jgi:hypothetical protein
LNANPFDWLIVDAKVRLLTIFAIFMSGNFFEKSKNSISDSLKLVRANNFEHFTDVFCP